MANPYSSAAGGTHFEARVVASYMVAVLSEAPARGLPGLYATQALTQRASFSEPLDDIIVTGLREGGAKIKLHLQIKSNLTFTEKDAEWTSVLQQAWETFQGTFNSDTDRLGIAVSAYSARADKHYQSVLTWATHSVDGKHFVERIEKKDFLHSDKRTFVATVRAVLPILPARDAVQAWRGPFGAAQDFRLGDIAVEVKSTASLNPASFKVASLDQLDAGELTLLLLHHVALSIDEAGGAERDPSMAGCDAARTGYNGSGRWRMGR